MPEIEFHHLGNFMLSTDWGILTIDSIVSLVELLSIKSQTWLLWKINPWSSCLKISILGLHILLTTIPWMVWFCVFGRYGISAKLWVKRDWKFSLDNANAIFALLSERNRIEIWLQQYGKIMVSENAYSSKNTWNVLKYAHFSRDNKPKPL